MFLKSVNVLLNLSYSGIYQTKTIRYKCGIIEGKIRNKLQAALQTTHLDVHELSESEKSNFKLVVVTDKFHGLPMHKRYNLIRDILKEELEAGTHISTIAAKTPIQWHRSLAAKEHSPDS